MRYDITSGVVSSGIILQHDSMYVSNGGTASNTVTNAWGWMFVQNGGVAADTTVNADGVLTISGGAVANGVDINADGTLKVLAGGSVSDVELTDLDEKFLATKITADDLTKTTRQLKVSMGELMDLFLVFGVAVFLLVIYLLAKLIIEKNAQSISMTKILGYTDGEINRLYVWMTSVVVVVSLIGTIPIVNYIMKYLFAAVLSDYPGWLPYHVSFSVYIRMAVLGIVSYAVVAFIQMRKVKNVSKSDALKAVE